MAILQNIRQQIAELISKKTGVSVSPNDIIFSASHGDLTLPNFNLAKSLNQAPDKLAKNFAPQIAVSNVRSSTAAGPYINFELERIEVAKAVLYEIKNPDTGNDKKERILLEYVSPNTNKPLHVGHFRNAVLGWSLSKILEANGNEVIKTQVINDRGIHIMKSLLAYLHWGNGDTPEKSGMKGDHFVGKYYVKFSEELKSNEGLETEAQSLLQRWEADDKNLRATWQQMNEWAENGISQTYERLGISFDRTDYESQTYEAGKAFVNEALKKGLVTKRADGAVIIDLKDEGLDEKVLLRADGTSVYITQDLALAHKRMQDKNPDLMIYVVGQEQDYHFKILFKILQKLGIVDTNKLKHVSYHWVFLPEGRMKSREGTVVDADELLDELHELAKKELIKRHEELAPAELERRAKIIALAAAKFFLLKVRPDSDIKFNPKESIAFTGATGPYLLYTLARMQSIFKKIPNPKSQIPNKTAINTITDAEWRLILALAQFPDVITKSAKAYDPSLVADFAYNLAKLTNDFYESSPVLKAEPDIRDWRLSLLSATHTILKSSLTMLGIETLEEM